jgi:hypothetical protein
MKQKAKDLTIRKKNTKRYKLTIEALKKLRNKLQIVKNEKDERERQIGELKEQTKMLGAKLNLREHHLQDANTVNPTNTKAVIPGALYMAMKGCWEQFHDYRLIGCCAVVLFFRLFTRSLDLLPVDQFLQFIGEHQDLFHINKNSLVLITKFDKCFPNLESILDLVMSPIANNSQWRIVFENIRKKVDDSKDKNDRWFMVHLPHTVRRAPHVFILVATRNNICAYGGWNGWSYTLYDQENRTQQTPCKADEYSERLCNAWEILFNQWQVPSPGKSACCGTSWQLEAESDTESYGDESSDGEYTTSQKSKTFNPIPSKQ